MKAVAGSTRVPLSSLREVPGELNSDTHWTTDSGHRALVQRVDSRITYPLTTVEPLEFTAQVRLPVREWRDGTGALSVSLLATTSDGRTSALTSTTLLSAADMGLPEPVGLHQLLAADTTAIHLDLRRTGAGGSQSVAQAWWIDPTLTIASRAPRTAPAAPRTTPPAPDPDVARQDNPVISVLTPVHDPPLEMLEECIASVVGQDYPHWELCLVDDGSSDPAVIGALQRHAAADPRIKLTRHDRAQGIAAATNRALELAGGEYVALLDHDDWLEPTALSLVADRLSRDPDLDMVYTDEDIVMDGRQIWVHHKQAWGADILATNGYTCHLGVYRSALLRRIGGFRTEFDGSQDVDMILRLTEQTDHIAHIPEILYHWRAHAASTAGGDAKPYAYVSARNAIAEHLKRTGVSGHVDFGPPGLYRVVHSVDPDLRVAVGLAVPDAAGLDELAASLQAQPHRAWSLVLAAPASEHEACRGALASAGVDHRDVRLLDSAPWSGATARGRHRADALASAATAAADAADFVLAAQAPPVGLTHDWLTRLLGYAQQPGIAAAAPVCLSPDGRVLDAGLAIINGFPLDLLYGLTTSMDDHFGFGTSVHNVSAARCVVMASAISLGRIGLDPAFGDLMLADFCLRAGPELRTVTVPDSRTRLDLIPDNDLPTFQRLAAAHPQSRDPYYNPHYRSDRGDFQLARPLAR